MVSEHERLINVVTPDKPKALDRLEPKGMWQVQGLQYPLSWTQVPPADRAGLNHPVSQVEHGKPVTLPSQG